MATKTPTEQIEILTKRLEQTLTKQIRSKWTEEQNIASSRKRDLEAKRKAETRRKIELGGLVIVAGAHQLEEATLVGLLSMAMANASQERLSLARERGVRVMLERKK